MLFIRTVWTGDAFFNRRIFLLFNIGSGGGSAPGVFLCFSLHRACVWPKPKWLILSVGRYQQNVWRGRARWEHSTLLTSASSQAGQWLEYLGDGRGTSWWPAETADSRATNQASRAFVGNGQKFGKQQKHVTKHLTTFLLTLHKIPYVCFDWFFFF